MKPGDTFTIAGIYELIPNSSRRWWQFWKPRFVKGPPKVFKVREWT